MYIDTHCHLNFSRFKKSVDSEINSAYDAGVETIIVPGTDIVSSRKAIEIAKRHANVYAAVGIHPHHAYEIPPHEIQSAIDTLVNELRDLVQTERVVAIGEVGLDSHTYEQTKYNAYTVTETFLQVQKRLLTAQINIAKQYNKSLILHNRETKTEMIELLKQVWNPFFEGRAVFHCCEADIDLLTFAKTHSMFVGIDGDVTYDSKKVSFIEKVPLEMLVLETDSPFLLPEPLKSQKKYPNGPRNIPLIADMVARIKEITIDTVMKTTTENAKRLFSLS